MECHLAGPATAANASAPHSNDNKGSREIFLAAPSPQGFDSSRKSGGYSRQSSCCFPGARSYVPAEHAIVSAAIPYLNPRSHRGTSSPCPPLPPCLGES